MTKLEILRSGDFTRVITQAQFDLAYSELSKKGWHGATADHLEALDSIRHNLSKWTTVNYNLRHMIERAVYQSIIFEEDEAKRAKQKDTSDYCMD